MRLNSILTHFVLKSYTTELHFYSLELGGALFLLGFTISLLNSTQFSFRIPLIPLGFFSFSMFSVR